MSSKKGLAIHWQILLISAIISIGIIVFYSNSQIYSPTGYIGEYSINLIKNLEKSKSIFLIIDGIMEDLIIKSITELNDMLLITGRDCGDYLGYKLLNDQDFENCIDKKFDIKEKFKEILKRKFSEFKSGQYGNLDFSNINFEFFVKEENEKFFVQGKTKDKLDIPIIKKEKTKEKQIGRSFIKPAFSIPTAYDFNEYEKLIENIEQLIEKCEQQDNPELCIDTNKKSIFSENFELLGKCESSEKENFFKFVEYVESCAKSEDNNCLCSRNKPIGKGSLRLLKDGNDVIISQMNDDGIIERIRYVELLDDKYTFVKDASYVHKDHQGKVLVQSYWPGKECNLKPKTKFRFCVKSTSKVYAYDNGNVDLRDVVYKFALQFPESKQEGKALDISGISPSKVSELLGSKLIVINAECKIAKEEVLKAAEKLGSIISDNGATVILPIKSGTCETLEGAESFKSKYIKAQDNILITLKATNENLGYLEYYKNTNKGDELSNSIVNSLKNINSFSDTLESTDLEILSVTDTSILIAFPASQISSEDKVDEYVRGILDGIVDYVENS